ncbi:MAG: DUF853 family protein, partial [Nitrososphaerota archaeon]|nr:DUF853 family protein [Nitrososphaerota archaeon]
MSLSDGRNDDGRFQEPPLSRSSAFFSGLYRTGTPFVYVVMSRPIDKDFFEYEAYMGTWVSGEERQYGEIVMRLEQQAKVLATALAVGLPGCSFSPLSSAQTSELADRLLSLSGRMDDKVEGETFPRLVPILPAGPGSVSIHSPPDFYNPLKMENVPTGLPLGRVVVAGQQRQELYLDTDDIGRHVCILGMTGSGKTTTAMALAARLGERGVPFMVLDTHNEYARLAHSVGGVVVAPGKDEFVLNPLEQSGTKGISDHAALVSDIFSDIYRFTHPQSFLFRNAVLKLLS